MDNHNLIKDIGRKMADYKMQPPENLWDDIEKALEKDAVIKQHAYNSYKTVKWAAAAIFAGAIVLGGSIWIGIVQDKNMVHPTASVHINSTHGLSSCHETNDIKSANNTISAPVVAVVDKTARQEVTSILSDKETEIVSETENIPSENENKGNSEANYETDTESSAANNGENVHKKHNARANTPSLWNTTQDFVARNEVTTRFNISLLASNFLNATKQQEGYGELVAGTVWKDDSSHGGSSSDNDDAMEGVIVGNKDCDVYTKKRHRQPIKFGLSVNYQINRRLSVGSGIVYSYLSSDLTSGTDDYNYTTKQTLQYVGVPLNLTYTMFQGKHYSVYGTGGGMAEKCVKGNSTTDYMINGKVENTQHDKVSENRLQYSVNAAVGVQVKMTGNVGFYIEPGISYHFDNHSDVTNIYKDTPLNFSLGLGIRYSF